MKSEWFWVIEKSCIMTGCGRVTSTVFSTLPLAEAQPYWRKGAVLKLYLRVWRNDVGSHLHLGKDWQVWKAAAVQEASAMELYGGG